MRLCINGVLMREKTNAAWGQLQLPQASSSAALHTPLDDVAAILPAAWLRILSGFAVPPIYTICSLRGQLKIARTAPVASPYDTAFVILLLSGKCHFGLSRVSCSNLLPESEWRCWMSLLWVLFVRLTAFLFSGCTSSTSLLKSLPFRSKIPFFDSSHHTSKFDPFTGKKPFGFMHQYPFNLVFLFSPGLTYDHSFLLHLQCN